MKIFSLVALLMLSACATTAPQAEALLTGPQRVVRQYHVEGVPFIQQSVGHCGPASLAMVMRWAGREVDVAHLADLMLSGSKIGTLQESLISASRREGLMAVQVSGFDKLLEEISQGHPVIIFENLGLSWYPQWHYAVAIGFDLDREKIEFHSGPSANERTDLRVFERSWKHSDYWALVVLPPGKIAKSAGELENLRAAAGLELAQRHTAARASYEAILEVWTESLGARIGAANLAYKSGNYRSAVSRLREALSLYPNSEHVKHNLEVAERALKLLK